MRNVGFWEFLEMLSNTQNDDTEYVALVEGTADEYYVSETYVVNRRKKQKAFSGEIARLELPKKLFPFSPNERTLAIISCLFLVLLRSCCVWSIVLTCKDAKIGGNWVKTLKNKLLHHQDSNSLQLGDS